MYIIQYTCYINRDALIVSILRSRSFWRQRFGVELFGADILAQSVLALSVLAHGLFGAKLKIL